MVDSFGCANTRVDSGSIAGQANKLQKKIFSDMMAIDPQRAITSMKAWAKFLQLASRSRAMPGSTLEEYLPSRIIDAGELYVYGPYLQFIFTSIEILSPSEIC